MLPNSKSKSSYQVSTVQQMFFRVFVVIKCFKVLRPQTKQSKQIIYTITRHGLNEQSENDLKHKQVA